MSNLPSRSRNRFTVHKYLPLVFFGTLVASSCSFLKLDKETNCLNDTTACFKSDTTRPTFQSSTPAPASTESKLPILTVVFSEELKDPKPADIDITGSGKGQLTLTSITKIAANTYRFDFSPDTLSNGNINLDFSKLQDYNNNKVNYTLALTGNVDIEILFDVSFATNPSYHGGVSNGGGYTTTAVKWNHSYADDPGNNWDMRVTNGAVDCSAGTSYFTGAGLASATDVSRTFDRLTHFGAGAGNYRVVVCITNAALNKKGIGSVQIVRDDTAPSATHLPVSDDYNATKAMTVACSDHMDKIAIFESQLTPWDGNLANPADPADPDFDASGIVSVGQALSAAHPITNTTNPTRTKVKYRCIDIAGNKSPVGIATYLIDTTLPEVTVNLDSTFRQFVSTAGYTTTTLNFTTNQSGTQYRIVKNATSCAALDGTSIIGAGPFTTPPSAAHVVNASALDVGVNDIRVCVANVGALKWGTASLQITRDDTIPIVTPSVTTGTYGTVQVVNLTCAPNADKVAITSAVLPGSTPPAAPSNPNIDPNGNILFGAEQDQYTTPDASVSTLIWQCISKSGNRSVVNGTTTATYTVDSILPTVSSVSNSHNFVSNLAGAYNFTDVTFQVSRANLNYSIKSGSTNCTGGTVFASGTVPTAGQDITVRLNSPLAGPPNHFTAIASYDLKICVPNFIGALGYSTSTLAVVREDSIPDNVTGLTVTAATSTSVSLSWNVPSDNGPAGVGLYRIYQTTLSGDYTVATVYTSATNSVNVSGLTAGTTYYFVVKALDNAGNISAAYSNEVVSRITLSVTVAGYASAANGPFRVQLGTAGEILSFTANGTQVFSQAMTVNDPYSLSIISQPATQNCAFVGSQYGVLATSLTLQVTCVNGYSSGGSIIANKPAPLNYMLYRGNTSIVAGGGLSASNCTGSNTSGCLNGGGTFSRFSNPHGMTIVNGDIYIADRSNNRIRKYIVGTNTTSTFAGEGSPGTSDGTGLASRFNAPQAITTDGVNLYVIESPSAAPGSLRKIEIATGNVTTIAGDGSLTGGAACPGAAQTNCKDGSGRQAVFGDANGIAYHNGYLYIAEYGNNRLRRMNLGTGQVDTIAGNGNAASVHDVSGSAASFNGCTGVTVANNQLYVADFNGNKLLRVGLTSPFTVTTIAGTGTAGYADGPAASTLFNSPDHLTSDGTNIFISEYVGHRIRRWNPNTNRVSTIAGNGGAGDAAGVGVNAQFNSPVGIVSDGNRLYVAGFSSGKIYRIADQGLVGYWPVDPGVNPNDYSSDGPSLSNGSVVGGSLGTTADRYGNGNSASTLNGVNQYAWAAPSNLPSGTAPETMCAWIKPTALPAPATQPMVIMGHGGLMGNGMRSLGLRNNFGIHLISFRGRGSDVEFPFTTTTGSWSHICASFLHNSPGNQVVSVFVNGHLIGRAGTPTNWNTDSNALTIGGPNLGGDIHFNGAVADVRVYNRVLNEGEINALAQDAAQVHVGNSFNTGATGLLAQYEFAGGTTAAANLNASGPIGGALASSCSSPAGKDGDLAGSCYFGGGTNMSTTANSTGLPIGNAARTLCGWFSPQSMPLNKVLIAYGSTSGSNQGIGITLLNANTVQMFSWGATVLNFGYNIRLNTWQHICGTFSGTNVEMFANGKSLGTGVMPSQNTGVGSITLGSNLDGNAGLIFNGKIDDMRIYNNVLSAAQIRQLATQVPAGLVLRLDMNGDAADSSGYAQNTTANTGSLAIGRRDNANSAYRFLPGQGITVAHDSTLMQAQDISVSFWMKSPDLDGGATPLNASVLKKFQSFNTDGWTVKYDQTNFFHGYASGGGGTNSLKVRSKNVWNHYTYVKSGGSATTYINGANLTNANNVVSTIAPNTADVLIGYASGLGEITLEDVRIYNRALGATEVQALSGYHLLQSSPGLRLHVQADTFSNLTDGAPIAANWVDSAPDPYDVNYPSANAAQGVLSGTTNTLQYAKASSGMNGAPGLIFDNSAGTGDRSFIFGTGNATSYSGFTVCSAFLRKGFTYHGLVERRSGSNSDSWGMLNDAGSAMKFEMNSAGGNPAVSYGVADSAPAILCVINTSNQLFLYLNGALGSALGTGSTITGASSLPLAIGNRAAGGGQFYGTISEVSFMTKDASAAERQMTECYLSAKYSIPLAAGVVCP